MSTLIEKLEQRKQDFEAQFVSDFWILEGLDKAIDIVKQHQAESGWVRCAERLPKNPMFYLVDEEGEYFKARYFRGRWETSSKLRVYPEFWFDGKIGNPRKNIPVVLSKQPPSEVQDD
ncbi:hypothetical protein OY033_002927 [Shigella flexneri]|nr:hypothetical protein [Shigella flexneri]